MLKIQTVFLWTRCSTLNLSGRLQMLLPQCIWGSRHCMSFIFVVFLPRPDVNYFHNYPKNYRQLLRWFVLVKAILSREKRAKETALIKSAHLFIIKAHKGCYILVCSLGVGQGNSLDDTGQYSPRYSGEYSTWISQVLLYFEGNGTSPGSAEVQDSNVGYCNT